MGLVGQSIKKGRRHDRVAKDLCPVGKAEIGRDYHRSFFLALSEDLKEQFRTFLGKWDIAKLIQDQQVIAGIPLDKTLKVFILASFNQFIDQGVATDKPSPIIILTGFNPKGSRQVGLAGATATEKNDIPSLFDIVTPKSCNLGDKIL